MSFYACEVGFVANLENKYFQENKETFKFSEFGHLV